MLSFLRQRWFLLALIATLWFGMAWPQVAGPLIHWLPSNVVVASVTFVMALPLETGALWSAARRPGPAWLAAALNSIVAPPLGWLASHWFHPELGTGIIVATTVPCTLATAAVWTRRARGNDAVAFLVTIITNLSCFAVVPTWLWLLTSAAMQADVRRAQIDYGRIATGLVLLVVLPIIIAQLLRQWKLIGEWAARRKELLSYVAQCGVLLMVLIGAVDCGERLNTAASNAVLSTSSVIALLVSVAAIHLALLALGFFSSSVLRFARADAIAVALAGSQKTLMVGAYLALAVGPLAILPMVAYHAIQLVIDTLVAESLRGRNWAAGGQSSPDSA